MQRFVRKNTLTSFPLPPPYPLLKVVSLKRKLSSWGVGASQTHSYIFMFLDIYSETHYTSFHPKSKMDLLECYTFEDIIDKETGFTSSQPQ